MGQPPPSSSYCAALLLDPFLIKQLLPLPPLLHFAPLFPRWPVKGKRGGGELLLLPSWWEGGRRGGKKECLALADTKRAARHSTLHCPPATVIKIRENDFLNATFPTFRQRRQRERIRADRKVPTCVCVQLDCGRKLTVCPGPINVRS